VIRSEFVTRHTVFENKVCERVGLDCSATCCIGDSCADPADVEHICIYRDDQSLQYLAIGILGIVIIMGCIPALFRCGKKCVRYRFFEQIDEEDGKI
jgi:hypothetical protein